MRQRKGMTDGRIIALLVSGAVVVIIGAAAWIYWPAKPAATAVAQAHSGALAGTQSAPAPTTQGGGQDGALRAELSMQKAEADRLRRENERMQAQFAAQQRMAEERAKVRANITGSSWLTRNNGASDLMRGLPVVLIRDTVPRLPVARELRKMAAEHVKEAQKEDDANREWSKQFPDLAETHKNNAAREQLVAKNAEAAADRLQPEVLVSSAFQLMKDASMYGMPYFRNVVTDSVVFETRTDREGKYSFVDVPAGNYYVYALFDTRTNYIEWLVPVQLQGRPVNIDLENSNAAVVKNAP